MRTGLVFAVAVLAMAPLARAADGPMVQLGALTVTGKAGAPTPSSGSADDPQPFRYYPDDALAQHIEADVMLSCRVGPGGSTENCHVKSESVTGAGFGEKALQIWFRVKQPVRVGGEVWNSGTANIPIRFRIEKPS